MPPQALACYALANMRAMALSALPEVRKALRDPNPQIRVAAAAVVENIGPQAREAVPDLRSAIASASSEHVTCFKLAILSVNSPMLYPIVGFFHEVGIMASGLRRLFSRSRAT